MEVKSQVPKVLMAAKKAAETSRASGSHGNGPWDQGHWANRQG